MVAYSFQRQFAEPIERGIKRQTIRADRKRHVQQGETMQLYVGMRTRSCRLIAEVQCISVEPIRLHVGDFDWRVALPGRDIVLYSQLNDFAVSDGFADWADMHAFWRKPHPDLPVFSGFLLRWTS